jgi:hypothetical protein
MKLQRIIAVIAMVSTVFTASGYGQVDEKVQVQARMPDT